MIDLESKPVSGKENRSELTEQMAALSQFYEALNNRDLDLMAKNWAPGDEAVMDNPVGGIKRGWDEIRGVYERVFATSSNYWFEFHDYSFHQATDVFYVVGKERGEYASGNDTLPMAIRTSRVFRRIDGRWRQVHHHGSIDDPKLLSAYQDAVRANASKKR